MSHNWNTTRLTSVSEVLEQIKKFPADWMYRGQSRLYNCIIPSIDRGKLFGLNRSQKLDLERKCIQVYQSNVMHFAGKGEEPSKAINMVALMVLRHSIPQLKEIDNHDETPKLQELLQ